MYSSSLQCYSFAILKANLFVYHFVCSIMQKKGKIGVSELI